ncbi:hypothetical protein [Saccharomonospora xinjiangensis]|uniref:DUF2637 domain-containing protein n=1 Tax=Saccharomonospora xinjiangensis XJ-54 TaxID=882086 RepID=I0V4S2_9PSEU|nr:hypothetical protein [Saccharomonospora xinjiangensis]EID55125.1 hypothetical protein SacxiDRAFT_2912 [Saccharomonospora xinjiangensis XJ-54]
MSPADDRTPSGRTRRVRKLGKRISEARRLRGLVRDPDLQAVELERRGRRTLLGLWFFLALGLVYTTEGVHAFLSEGTTPADPLWWAAWTVEPMFAGLLITLLNFESVILSHGVEPDHRWWSRLKHVLLGSTLAMNVLPQLMPLAQGRWERFNLGSLAVHAIIPVIVYGIAEVIPVIQARQREIVLAVYAQADHHEATTTPEPEPTRKPAPEPATPEPKPVVSEPEPATASTLASAPRLAPAPPRKAPVLGKLPGSLRDTVTGLATSVHQQGRQVTAEDITQRVALPEQMVTALVEELNTTVNGYHPAPA